MDLKRVMASIVKYVLTALYEKDRLRSGATNIDAFISSIYIFLDRRHNKHVLPRWIYLKYTA